MKPFLYKSLFFLLPICLMAMVIELVLRNSPNDYFYKHNYMSQHATEINTLILGSSHAFRGINPEYLGDSAFNLANVSQTLDYDYYLFQKYQDKLVNLKYVIISVSYFSYFEQLGSGIESWRTKNYAMYFDINTSNSLYDRFEVTSNKLPVLYQNLKSIIKQENGQSRWHKGSLPSEVKNADIEKLEKDGKKAAERHTKSDTGKLKEQVLYLTKIINYCKSKDIEVVLVATPVYKTYYNLLDSAQLNTMLSITDQLDNRYTHVHFLNIMQSDMFGINDFYNSDHLNAKGAEKLSKTLYNYIQNIKNEEK